MFSPFAEATVVWVLTAMEGIGVVAFALSGVLAAVRKRLDLVGVVFVAFVTALGGGTLRDVLLRREPFFLDSSRRVGVGGHRTGHRRINGPSGSPL